MRYSWLLMNTAGASLIITAGVFIVALVVVKFHMSQHPPVALVLDVAPVAIAGLWMSQRLETRYPRTEARTAAIALAVFSPVVFGVALALAQLGGSLPTAIAMTAVIATILNFGVVSFGLWARRGRTSS